MSIDRQLNSTTTSALPSDGSRREQIVQLLQTRGADQIAHLNGTLLAHLERTELLLRRWGCSETVSLAGLSHAVYGTDGFPTALLTVEERTVLREVAGPDVEALVYLYASCDRAFVYPRLSSGRMDFRDRFTGLTFLPARGELRDLVDLTLANESDVGLVGTSSDEVPEWLLTMFSLFQHLASASVRDGFNRLTSASADCRGKLIASPPPSSMPAISHSTKAPTGSRLTGSSFCPPKANQWCRFVMGQRAGVSGNICAPWRWERCQSIGGRATTRHAQS